MMWCSNPVQVNLPSASLLNTELKTDQSHRPGWGQRLLHRWKQRVTPISLATLLCLTGGWIAGEAIAPAGVQAYTSRVDVALDVQPEETYDTLIHRAETIARAAAQRSFDHDILVTDVSVVITAQNSKGIAPILSLTATRPQWQSRPESQAWATYYRSAIGLLKLNTVATQTDGVPSPRVIQVSSPTQPPTPPKPKKTPTAKKQPTTAHPASTRRTPQGGATTNRPQQPASSTPSSGTTPIIPKRIPTPGGIGK